MKRVTFVGNIGVLVVLLAVTGAGLVRNECLSPVRAAPQETVITLSGERIRYASLATADFNGDDYKEIVAGGEDGMLYVVSTSNGTTWSTVWSHQVNTEIEAANPPTSRSTNEIASSPAIADLDGDGKLEIVVAVGGSVFTSSQADRHNGGVLVYEYNSAWSFSSVAGWPQPKIDAAGDETQGYGYPDGLWDGYMETPALGDLDGDGDLEIVISGPGRRIHAWHHDGSKVAGWPIYRDNGDNILRGSYLSSAALGDIDGDGLPEVIIGTQSPPWDGVDPNPDYDKGTVWGVNGDSTNVPGFPIETQGYIHSSPALGDIDGDGQLEIVVGSGSTANDNGDMVYAWNHDGTSLPNWPQEADGLTKAPPALGDIDGDGDLEIVIGEGNTSSTSGDGMKLWVWNVDGSTVSGFPTLPKSPNNSHDKSNDMPWSPVVADLEGDGDTEILVVQVGGWGMAVVKSDGSSSDSDRRYSSSFGGSLSAPPVVDDIDGDGNLETLAGGGKDNGVIIIWEETGTTGSYRPWPMFRQNIERTGLYGLYDVSGKTMHANGQPFSGVTVSAGSGLNDITDASGDYEFTDLDEGTYALTPSLGSYVFSPPTRDVTLPPSASGQSFFVLPSPVSISLVSGTAASLSYNDTQGLSTQLDFAADAVTQTTNLVLTPTMASGGIGFAFTGHAFELAAYQGGVLQPGFTFSTPVTITIHYNDDDVRVVSDESALILYWWTGSAWQDAAETCSPASTYIRGPGNSVSVPICHLSKFGLLGPTHNIYLPLVMRNS